MNKVQVSHRGRFLGDAKNRGASLRQAGIEIEKVYEAGNGAEALVVMKDAKWTSFLCDINMPVMMAWSS